MNCTITLEHGIPRPLGGRPPAPETIAMKTMEIGDSFLITDYCRWLVVRGKLTKHRPRRYSLRKVPGGWRLWRVE